MGTFYDMRFRHPPTEEFKIAKSVGIFISNSSIFLTAMLYTTTTLNCRKKCAKKQILGKQCI